MRTGQITWDETDGVGMLTLVWDDGRRETVASDVSIDAGSDSYAIANLFGGADTIDHDGEVVHISR